MALGPCWVVLGFLLGVRTVLQSRPGVPVGFFRSLSGVLLDSCHAALNLSVVTLLYCDAIFLAGARAC